jgi:hypothetical protein
MIEWATAEGWNPGLADPGEVRIIGIGPPLVLAILAYDRAFFPVRREAFLRLWLSPPHAALALVEGGQVTGYGVAHACRTGLQDRPHPRHHHVRTWLTNGETDVSTKEVRPDTDRAQTDMSFLR